MRRIQTISHRIRSLFRKNKVEAELSDELRFHMDRQIAENIASGMTQDEARRAALRDFGGVEQVKEEGRDARRVVSGTLGPRRQRADLGVGCDGCRTRRGAVRAHRRA